MRVVLDTNIYYGNWHLESANFTYLFHYLNNEYAQLLLPEIVRRETNNNQARELEKAIADAKLQLEQARRLNGTPVVSVPFPVTSKEYDLETLLKERVERVVRISYETLSQSAVVDRALEKRRPFQDKGSGYADTVIWLSLLGYLEADSSEEPVAFITKNRADFFDMKASGKTTFHTHLLADLSVAQLRAEVIPYDSLEAFVESTIDKHTHALDHTKVEALIRDALEEAAVRSLESLEPRIVTVLSMRLARRTSLIHNASAIDASIVEGIEDFRVVSTKDLGDSNIYIRVDFDLRVVDLSIRVALGDFRSAEADLWSAASFYDVQTDDDSAVLQAVIRPRFDASVIYNKRTGDVSAFDITSFQVMS